MLRNADGLGRYMPYSMDEAEILIAGNTHLLWTIILDLDLQIKEQKLPRYNDKHSIWKITFEIAIA